MPAPTQTTLWGSSDADVITFSDRYLLHDYINPFLPKELNSLSEKCGAT